MDSTKSLNEFANNKFSSEFNSENPRQIPEGIDSMFNSGLIVYKAIIISIFFYIGNRVRNLFGT